MVKYLNADEPDNIYQKFIEKVYMKMHIVLCMSPAGDQLRVRCRKYPSFINCCTLDLYTEWPHEALLSLSTQLLADFKYPAENYRLDIPILCKEIHQQCKDLSLKYEHQLKRKVYNTPKNYMDFIKIF